MSTSKIRKTRKARMQTVGFEMDPPACANCKHFKHAQYANPGLKSKLYVPPLCVLNHFQVRPNSICDEWVDKKSGDRLEPKKEQNHVMQ